MNKFQEKSLRTRMHIVNEFWSLLAKKNVNSISVTEISKNVGINRSTFYLHFTDVYDILRSEQERLASEWKSQFEDLPDDAGTEQMLKLFSDYYRRNGEQVYLLLSENSDKGFERKMEEIIRPRIKPLLRFHDDTEFDYTFEFYIKAFVGVIIKWYPERADVPIEKVLELIHKLMNSGMAGVWG